MSSTSLGSRRSLALLGLGLLLAVGLLVVPRSSTDPRPPLRVEEASSTYLCSGYDPCAKAGYSHAGYKTAGSKMYWRMYSGHNCTNYVAYRMIQAGMSTTRPWSGTGNAYNWGVAMRDITDQTPAVGAVAWWRKNVPGAGSNGHVAYVQQVVSSTEIVISEDSWSGDFHWRRIVKSGTGWPSGFIHFKDAGVTNTKPPTITGTTRVGSALKAAPGSWSTKSSFAYQWLSDGKPIAGATHQVHVPTAAERTHPLTVRVTATAPKLTPATATSAATPAIGYGLLTQTEKPVLSGDPIVDEPLTVSQGSWTPTPTSRRVTWYADGTAIDGATDYSFTPTSAQAGKAITARVVGVKAGYANARSTTSPTVPVFRGSATIDTPFTWTGTTAYGETLSVAGGAVTPSDAKVTYTWLRNGRPIAGATGATYTLGPDDVGTVPSVRVDVTRNGWVPASQVLRPATKVTTTSATRVSAVGRPGRGVVQLRVTAPGRSAPPGKVTVTVGQVSRTVYLVDGRAKVVLTGVRAGQRRVVVVYAGTPVVLGSQARATVVIPKA